MEACTIRDVETVIFCGEGIADMLLLLDYWTKKTMVEKLTFSNVVQCVVLEVKITEGHETTIVVSIPVGGTRSIGPVHKNNVLKASVNVEKKREYAAILAFDVEVKQEVQKYADELGMKVFVADSIYHLSKPYKAYIDISRNMTTTYSLDICFCNHKFIAT